MAGIFPCVEGVCYNYTHLRVSKWILRTRYDTYFEDDYDQTTYCTNWKKTFGKISQLTLSCLQGTVKAISDV